MEKEMTDREMLGLAAKAAGLHVGFGCAYTESGRYDLYWSHVHHQLAWHHKTAGSEYPKPVFWNPLADDGDALQLAVKLRLEPRFLDLDHPAGPPRVTFHNVAGLVELAGNDLLAATRRAIVRAAAEIGRAEK